MKPFIDFNTQKRAEATNDFEKSFYKLLNNSNFGKCIENLMKRMVLKIVTTDEEVQRLVAKPNFLSFRVYATYG
jgi:hypothetical protein